MLAAASADDWVLDESNTVTFALVLTELLTNASKNSAGPAPRLELIDEAKSLTCTVVNHGELVGSPLQHPPLSGGLSILKLMIPEVDQNLRLYQKGDRVYTEYRLSTAQAIRQYHRHEP